VFNNPFDSFHNMVAEAKEEREQLDRLLTISTPRERLLVAVVAVLLLALGAWLFFGSVTRSLVLDGVLVEPGPNVSDAIRSVQALVWIEGDRKPGVKGGMPVDVELGASGEAVTVEGEVTTVTAVRLAPGLKATPLSVYRVGIALDEDFSPASVSDRECRIVVELGGQAPVAFFGMGRS